MKKVFIILISIVIANLATAQTTANEAIEGCVFGAMGNEKFEKFGYINSHGEKTTCSFDDIAALLQKRRYWFLWFGR